MVLLPSVDGIAGGRAAPGVGLDVRAEYGNSYFFATSDGLDIRPGDPDLGEYKTEVDRYPRDQEFIPDWLREKLERWRVEHGPAVAKRVAQLEVEFRLKGRTFRYP